MYRIVSIFFILISSSVVLFAQEKESEKVKKITIISVDRDGVKKQVTKEIVVDADEIEWTDKENGEYRIVLRNGGDEEVVIVKKPKAKKGGFLGIYLGESSAKGVEIKGIIEGTAAEQAGLLKGDIITAIDGVKIESTQDLLDVLANKKPGEEIELDYLRNDKSKSAKVILGKKRGYDDNKWIEMTEKDIIIEIDNDDVYIEKASFNRGFLGIYPAEEVKGVKGVMVLNTVNGSAAEKAGLQTGDVITKIDDSQISNFEDLKKALADKKSGDEIDLGYSRQGKAAHLKVALTSYADVKKSERVIIKKEKD